MSKRVYRTNGKIPSNLYELSHVTEDGANLSIIFCPTSTLVGLEIARKPWFSFLSTNSLLWKHIETNYKHRPFVDDITHQYIAPFDFSDFTDLESYITNKSCSIYWKNMYKYDKLWEALTVEFNPLWNVDGVEETVRTLERDGTIVNAKSGNDATAKSGNDALVKSGTVTDAESGTTAESHTGTITNAQTGTDTVSFEGSETDTKNGVHTSAVTGGEVHEKYEATTDSLDMLKTEKTVDTFGDDSNTDSKTTTDTDTNVTNVHAYTDNRRNVDTKNLNNTQTNANTDTTTHGKTDTTTFNNTDTQNYNSTDTTTYNSSNTETLDTIDTERTVHERHGNIGVTTTTQLLTEYVEYAKLVDFVDIVARDILESITMGVY